MKVISRNNMRVESRRTLHNHMMEQERDSQHRQSYEEHIKRHYGPQAVTAGTFARALAEAAMTLQQSKNRG